MDYVLECKSLTKSFGAKVALSDFSLDLSRGRILGLLGPNGSGKTTLIKILNGLLTPNAGMAKISGYLPGKKARAVVSYLPDRDFLPKECRVCDLVSYYKDFYSNFNENRAREMLSNLNIDRFVKLKTLSKGNREKVALILVMSRDADLYLLDEPIAGVDPAARDYILNTILSNYNDNSSIIISTHLIADVEQILSDVLFLKDGRVELVGDADEIRISHNNSIDGLFREVFRC